MRIELERLLVVQEMERTLEYLLRIVLVQLLVLIFFILGVLPLLVSELVQESIRVNLIVTAAGCSKTSTKMIGRFSCVHHELGQLTEVDVVRVFVLGGAEDRQFAVFTF